MVRILSISVTAAFAVLLASCNDHDTPTSNRTNRWTLTSTPSSAEGTDACVVAPPAGSVTYPQSVTITDYSIRFTNLVTEEDSPVFVGTVSGNTFTASSHSSFDASGCGRIQWTDVLTGTLSADRNTLTATQVDTFVEPSGHQVVIRYAVTGVRD